jgi:hypothetical protein
MPGTNVYSVLFYVGAFIAFVVGVNYLMNLWRSFTVSTQNATSKNEPMPSWVPPTIKTALVAGVMIVVFNLGWNMMQSVTTHSSNYQNPAEVAEKKKVQESKLPSTEEINATRINQRQRSEIKPHKDALDSFDKSMQEEAEKIQKRSAGN